MAPILPLLQIWTHMNGENPYINKEKYALLDKKQFKFLDESQKPTNDIGYWVSDPQQLKKTEDTLIVSNKIASKDSKYSLEILSLFAFFNYKNKVWEWEKYEAPDFILYDNGEKTYAEITSTTSKYAWKMNTNCFAKLSKKKNIADSIMIINKQIIKAMNKKNNKIHNYMRNTNTKKGVLIIHLSSLAADIEKLMAKGIDLNAIMPPNTTMFDEVFWVDSFANSGVLKRK